MVAAEWRSPVPGCSCWLSRWQSRGQGRESCPSSGRLSRIRASSTTCAALWRRQKATQNGAISTPHPASSPQPGVCPPQERKRPEISICPLIQQGRKSGSERLGDLLTITREKNRFRDLELPVSSSELLSQHTASGPGPSPPDPGVPLSRWLHHVLLPGPVLSPSLHGEPHTLP